MKSDVSVKGYFYKYAKQVGSMDGIVRATNGIVRYRVDGMNRLCTMTEEDLYRARNVGEGTVKLILRVCEQRRAERAG